MTQTTRKIGIIGSGNAGQTLGRAFQALGHDVLIGSRNPANVSLDGLRVGTLSEAARFGDLLVNTAPGEASLETLKQITAADMAGKVLIDVGVGLDPDNGSLTYPVESGAEVLQAAFPDVKIVKTFCTMTSTIMVDPALLSAPTSIFLSGDDVGAKAEVSQLLTELGWTGGSQIDLGGIETARGQEHFAQMYFALTTSLGHDTFNIAVVAK